ncbi:hypothetical protein [Prevotella sp. HUN102]|uniref:hypothetical protein n=1 Tax=Prevotella sp. HUN102 TaxID=1392486 RepID=UPI00048DC0E8|nr:hypothetical protein [Prevotella sp. HUN102]
MKKITIALAFLLLCGTAKAQEAKLKPSSTSEPAELLATASEATDSVFKTRIANEEYQVWLDINFYDSNIIVPNQDIFGELPGYLGSKRDSRKWIILEAEVESNNASLLITNDYGSEDLTATLTCEADSSYTLTQKEGSTMKIAVNGKWVKLPKKLKFVKDKKA